MKKLLWLIERLWAHRLARQTQQQLVDLATAPTRASERRNTAILEQQASQPGPQVLLGYTEVGQPVQLPLSTLVQAHSIITGGSGSGKTMALLLIIDAIIAANIESLAAQTSEVIGFGLIDPKTELFLKTLFLLAQQLATLPPTKAEALCDRIHIIDLAYSDPLTPYNIAQPWADCDLDFFATSRVETMSEVLAAGDGLSLRGSLIVKELFKLLAECEVPFGYIERVITNEDFRNALVARARSETIRYYFRTQFPRESKATLAALQARLSSGLLSTQSLRLALSGDGVPDFRRIQDKSDISLINCGGANIPRPTARVMLGLILSDFRQGVFARQTNHPYLMIVDEAQVTLRTKQLRENADELLRLARSFGSFFCLVTQNLTAGANDADLIEVIQTNIKWSLSLRSTPRDAAFLKPALPVTGHLPKTRINPFLPLEFYSLTEERAIQLESIAHLPDRVGWLWLKALTSEAIKIKTAPLDIPSGSPFTQAVGQLRSDPSFGQRISRLAYFKALAERERSWSQAHMTAKDAERSDKVEQLKQRYKKTRGGSK